MARCDARPMVTFPAIMHHWPVTSAKLYCLVTEARVCEQLAEWSWTCNLYVASSFTTRTRTSPCINIIGV